MQVEGIEQPATAGEEAVAQRVVLFDFDGVLLHGDAFELFIRDRYQRSLLRKLMVLPCLPWLLLMLPFSRRLAARTLVHVALFATGEKRYQAKAQAFASGLVQNSRRCNRDALRQLRRHQQAGDRVIVVTGCEQALVGSILGQLGLGDVELLASRLRPGWSGMRTGFHNIGANKLKALSAHGVRAWQVAYTDSLMDVPMLKPAAEPVLVNGTPKLCKKMDAALGRVVGRVEWQ
ncbi:HAD family hydrolase [Rhodanobacter sp. DHG33]|uniref:HAD family hydrolase n=1 Tax=Rhodanobacter sp. DHG33 TaxID=2775921 RepID=UPI0017838381|nr:HAD family hydrolase [Rhodanobacter sp. DHG33]MBD8897587.1 haloacid dehalogenase-like hydrolase [Rhodanobacter sp. DHG33]